MLTGELPPKSGGIGYYVYNLSKKLVQRGHEVTIIAKGSTNRYTYKVVDGINIFAASFFPLYPFHVWIHKAFVKILFKSLEPKLDLVHLHSPIVPPVKTSLPIITTVHTSMKVDSEYHEICDFYSLAERLQCKVFYPPAETKLFRISSLITAVSHSVADELRQYGLDPNKIPVVRNGVDENTFSPLQSRAKTEKYVLYTGGLRARKGLFDLLECAQYVCQVNQNVHFVVVGQGPLFGRLFEAVRKKGMGEKVILLGFVKRDRLISLYKNATVHVIPSHYEGLPTVLLEAMSCGLPVVATNVSGNREVITNGVNGFLVPPKTPKQMAEIILKLLDSTALRESIGKAARKTIEDYYTWDKITDNIIDCYENLLNP
jgi:glycosyltransferase involved in cell wall biosynthesis